MYISAVYNIFDALYHSDCIILLQTHFRGSYRRLPLRLQAFFQERNIAEKMLPALIARTVLTAFLQVGAWRFSFFNYIFYILI